MSQAGLSWLMALGKYLRTNCARISVSFAIGSRVRVCCVTKLPVTSRATLIATSPYTGKP